MPISVTERRVVPAPPSSSFRLLVPLDSNRTYLRIKNDTQALTMYLDTCDTFFVNDPHVHTLLPGEVLTLWGDDATCPFWVFWKWME